MNPITAKEPRLIETLYREARNASPAYFKDEVLEAVADDDGNLVFDYADAENFEKTAKTNRTNYVTYSLMAGAVNGETFGIDWSKVQSASGRTYSIRQEAKTAGLKWRNGRWAR